MQHGENWTHLPRQVSKAVGKRMCGTDRDNGRRWQGTPDTMFQAAEANMSKVKVTIKKKRV